MQYAALQYDLGMEIPLCNPLKIEQFYFVVTKYDFGDSV